MFCLLVRKRNTIIVKRNELRIKYQEIYGCQDTTNTKSVIQFEDLRDSNEDLRDSNPQVSLNCVLFCVSWNEKLMMRQFLDFSLMRIDFWFCSLAVVIAKKRCALSQRDIGRSFVSQW